MKPRLLIHMGAGKCGSSAIQQLLRDNADIFLQRGILIPDRHCSRGGVVTGQHNLFFDQFMELSAADASAQADEHFTQLAAVACEAGAHTVLLSCENFINPVDRASRLAPLTQLFEVSLLLYVRRQLDYLASAWQQWYVKLAADKDSFLTENIGVIANWNHCLQSWERIFGESNISVRRYGKGLLKNDDVVTDYCSAFELDMTGLKFPEAGVNPSFCDAVTYLAERNAGNYNSINDDGFFRWLQSLLGAEVYRRAAATSYPFSQQDISRVEAAYGADNAELVTKYLPQLQGAPLFTPVQGSALEVADPALVAAQARRLALNAIAVIDAGGGSRPYRYPQWRALLDSVAGDTQAGGREPSP